MVVIWYNNQEFNTNLSTRSFKSDNVGKTLWVDNKKREYFKYIDQNGVHIEGWYIFKLPNKKKNINVDFTPIKDTEIHHLTTKDKTVTDKNKYFRFDTHGYLDSNNSINVGLVKLNFNI